MNNRYSFIGGRQGPWRVTEVRQLIGAGLEPVERVNIINAAVAELPLDSSWVLQSFVSNLRYARRDEVTTLRAVQPSLNRSEAVFAILIPIKKQPPGGNWLRMNDAPFLKSSPTIRRLGWNIFQKLHGSCTTVEIWENLLTFSPGLNLPQSIPRHLTNCSYGCEPAKNGSMSNAR